MSPDETMWDPLKIGDAFSNNNAHSPNHFSPPPPPQSIAPEEKSSQPAMIGANENVRIHLFLLL